MMVKPDNGEWHFITNEGVKPIADLTREEAIAELRRVSAELLEARDAFDDITRRIAEARRPGANA